MLIPISSFQSDTSLAFQTSITLIPSLEKGLKHKYINKYLYYLADKASTSFDKNEVGQSTKGTYILQELNGGIFWFQICEYTSTKLVLKNKLGQTLTFKKQ